jgi:hypothetical protein
MQLGIADQKFSTSKSFLKESVKGLSGKMKPSYMYDPEFQMKSSSEEALFMSANFDNVNQMEGIQYSNQYINQSEWENISKTLLNNPNITTITLSAININDQGLKMLGEVIRQNSCVKNLKLEWNYLNEHPDDFDFFCDCLARSKITYLAMNNNKINSRLASSIAKLIKNSSTLLYLDLRWNEIGNEGAKIIISSLMKNSCILELNMIGNKVNEECMREITDCIRKNKSYANAMYNMEENNKNNNMINNFTKSVNTKSMNYEKSIVDSPTKVFSIAYENNKDVLPMKILEKEREISEEFKARYDVQLISNSKLEKRNRELEKLLEIERAKVVEAKENYDKEISGEKELRLKYEEQIIQLKETVVKMNVDKNRIENENEIRLTSYINDASNLQNTNRILKETLERTTQTYEDKYELLKTEYEKNFIHLNSNVEQVKQENEKIKRDMNDEIKNNLRDYEKKIKTYEENLRTVKFEKEQEEKQNLVVKKELLDAKVEMELSFRERERKYVNEEATVKENLIRNYEKRIKILETSNEEINFKYTTLLQELNNLKKTLNDEQIKYENKINTLNGEIININKTNITMHSESNKLITELKSRDAIMTKYKNSLDGYEKKVQEMSKMHSENNAKFESEINLQRERSGGDRRELGNKIKDLELTIESLKYKLNKLDNDLPRISENLKKTIFNYIDNN